jgi:plasmid stabilization system protein ParE
MRYKSVIENLAKEDLITATKWYDTQQKGLGKKFLATVMKTIAQIKKYPFIAQIRYFEVHTAVVEVYPYLVHYYIDPDRKAIIIIGVLHTSRDPIIWNKRV